MPRRKQGRPMHLGCLSKPPAVAKHNDCDTNSQPCACGCRYGPAADEDYSSGGSLCRKQKSVVALETTKIPSAESAETSDAPCLDAANFRGQDIVGDGMEGRAERSGDLTVPLITKQNGDGCVNSDAKLKSYTSIPEAVHLQQQQLSATSAVVNSGIRNHKLRRSTSIASELSGLKASLHTVQQQQQQQLRMIHKLQALLSTLTAGDPVRVMQQDQRWNVPLVTENDHIDDRMEEDFSCSPLAHPELLYDSSRLQLAREPQKLSQGYMDSPGQQIALLSVNEVQTGNELDGIAKDESVRSILLSRQPHLHSQKPQPKQLQPEPTRAHYKHRCTFCQKVLGSSSALQIHIRSHTGERPYECTVCGSRFSTKGNLKSHGLRHEQQMPTRMPMSSAADDSIETAASIAAATAVAASTPPRPQSAADTADSLTGERDTFEAAGTVQPQMQTSSRLAPPRMSAAVPAAAVAAQMADTDRSCSMPSPEQPVQPVGLALDKDPFESYEDYMEITKPESSKLEMLVRNINFKVTDPNQCVICKNILSCKSALQMHYRTHTGEKPYKCKMCGRAFTTKGNLKTHMKTHKPKGGPAATITERLHHGCPVCSKQFSSTLVLTQHLRAHAESAIAAAAAASAVAPDETAVPTTPPTYADELSAQQRTPPPLPLSDDHFVAVPLANGSGRYTDGQVGVSQQSLAAEPGFGCSTSGGSHAAADGFGDDAASNPASPLSSSSLSCSPAPAPASDYAGQRLSALPRSSRGAAGSAVGFGSSASNAGEASWHRPATGHLLGYPPDGQLNALGMIAPPLLPFSTFAPLNMSVREQATYAQAFASSWKQLSRLPFFSSPLTGGYLQEVAAAAAANAGSVAHGWDAAAATGSSPAMPSRRLSPGGAATPATDTVQGLVQHALLKPAHGKCSSPGSRGSASSSECSNDGRGGGGGAVAAAEAHDSLLGCEAPSWRLAAAVAEPGRGLHADSRSQQRRGSDAYGQRPAAPQLLAAADNASPFAAAATTTKVEPKAARGPTGATPRSGSSSSSSTTCDICSKAFPCRSALEIHYRSHTKEKPFKCEMCDKSFTTKGNMKQHMQVHMPLPVSWSAAVAAAQPTGAAMALPPMLSHGGSGSIGAFDYRASADSSSSSPPLLPGLEHSALATVVERQRASGGGVSGGNRHCCAVCKKAFSSASALQIHVRTHTGDRPFKCTVCPKAFATKGNLKVHILGKHPQALWVKEENNNMGSSNGGGSSSSSSGSGGCRDGSSRPSEDGSGMQLECEGSLLEPAVAKEAVAEDAIECADDRATAVAVDVSIGGATLSNGTSCAVPEISHVAAAPAANAMSTQWQL